jgi:hypothetical protein
VKAREVEKGRGGGNSEKKSRDGVLRGLLGPDKSVAKRGQEELGVGEGTGSALCR